MWIGRKAAFYRNKKYMNVDEQKKELERQKWIHIINGEELNKAYF